MLCFLTLLSQSYPEALACRCCRTLLCNQTLISVLLSRELTPSNIILVGRRWTEPTHCHIYMTSDESSQHYSSKVIKSKEGALAVRVEVGLGGVAGVIVGIVSDVGAHNAERWVARLGEVDLDLHDNYLLL